MAAESANSPNVRERFLIICSLALTPALRRKVLPAEANPESHTPPGSPQLRWGYRSPGTSQWEAAVLLRRSNRRVRTVRALGPLIP